MKILVVPDLHFPFHHKAALKRVLKYLTKTKYTHIVQLGDLYDQYCFTKFPKKNVMLPQEEVKQARKYASDMWATIRKLQPRAKLYQLLGNHDVRLLKRAEEKFPEAQDLVKGSLLDLYRFPHVKTITDPRDELVIGGIVFIHGYLGKPLAHVKWNHKSVVHGHNHRASIIFTPIKGKLLWELDAGFLADIRHEPLGYHPQRTTNWVLGHAEIINGVPRFIPYKE